MIQSISSPLFLIGYFAFFGAVHSLLADLRFKNQLRRYFGEAFDRWSRLAFTILALVMISPFIYVLLFLPKRTLYAVPSPFSWLMAAGQALAALAVIGALRQTGVAYFLGLAQLRGKVESGGLVTDGFYCHLRNPLFFFGAIFLWLSSTP